MWIPGGASVPSSALPVHRLLARIIAELDELAGFPPITDDEVKKRHRGPARPPSQSVNNSVDRWSTTHLSLGKLVEFTAPRAESVGGRICSRASGCPPQARSASEGRCWSGPRSRFGLVTDSLRYPPSHRFGLMGRIHSIPRDGRTSSVRQPHLLGQAWRALTPIGYIVGKTRLALLGEVATMPNRSLRARGEWIDCVP